MSTYVYILYYTLFINIYLQNILCEILADIHNSYINIHFKEDKYYLSPSYNY